MKKVTRKLRRMSNPYWKNYQLSKLMKRREMLIRQYEIFYGQSKG